MCADASHTHINDGGGNNRITRRNILNKLNMIINKYLF